MTKEVGEILVSVGVITYNSAKTIVETLDSIKLQTYKNLELVISDDGSKDDTVEICQKWLDENSNRFVRVELLTVEHNTGTAANCNRCTKATQGLFIKRIAGDDILEPECIRINIENIGNADMAVSDMVRFNERGVVSVNNNFDILFPLSVLQPQKRLKLFCRLIPFFNPPSHFYRRSLYEKIGYFEESTKELEDVPFYVKIFASGLSIKYIQKTTVRYRLNGISHSPETRIKLQRLLIYAYKKYCRQYLSVWNPIDFLKIVDYSFWDIVVKSNSQFLVNFYMSRYNFLHRYIDNLIIKRALKEARKEHYYE